MGFDISTLLNQSANAHLSPEDMFKRMYLNLVTQIAARDERFTDLLMLESLEPDQREKMEGFANSLYRRLGQAFEPFEATQYMVAKAFAMDRQALDKVCRIIVEHFFEEEIIEPSDLQQEFNRMVSQTSMKANSPRKKAIDKAVRDSFPAYQSLHYRLVAGPVFDFPVSDIERAGYQAQKKRLFDNAIFRGLNAPLPKQSDGRSGHRYPNLRDPDLEI